MKKNPLVFLIITVVLFISGCSSAEEELPDTYVEGSDFQYMYLGMSNFPLVQKGEEGYYFLWNNFIYYYDERQEIIVPLCSKADCLHDQETDQEKLEACNAYIDCLVDTGIAYSDGNIYCVEMGTGREPSVLYRVSSDGSRKEKLYEWKEEGRQLVHWIVHRDVLYYTVNSYSVNDEEIEDYYAFCCIPLSGRSKLKEKQIYEPESGVDIVAFGTPTAYGNHIYFSLIGNREGWDGSDETGLDYIYNKTFVYDIRTDEIAEITLPDQAASETIGGVAFWKDKIIFTPFDGKRGYLADGDWYIAELDGSDPQILLTTKQGYNLFSDGKYLYLSNANMNQLGKDESPKLYRVYDEDMEEIDTFTTDDLTPADFAIGNPEKCYRVYYTDDGEFGLTCWDKSVIGSLNGAEIRFVDIPYSTAAKE